jgi:ligand-binding sensor domain-containing protein
MLKNIIALAIFTFLVNDVSNIIAQNSTSGWNIYTSFREVKGIGIGQDRIWAASTGGLFNFDKNNTSDIIKYTSLDGLQSNDLTSVSVSNDNKVWAGAFDGSISVLNLADNTWGQITDIRNSTEPTKKVNAFYQYNNLMFFATEFCIVKFSIPQFQFVDQPYIFLGPMLPIKSPVNDLFVVNDTIWAATKNGIAYANINSNLPIQSNWKNFTVNNSVLIDNLINCVTYFNSKVIMGTDSGMVYYQSGTLNTYAPQFNSIPIEDPVYRMAVSDGNLYFSTYTNYGGYRGNFRVFKVSQSNFNNAELILSGIEVNSLKVNSNGDLMIGTINIGVDVYKNNTNNFVIPNGPFSNLNFNIEVEPNSNLWAVSGSLGDWVNRSGIYKYNGS